jgi:hypothetical protein
MAIGTLLKHESLSNDFSASIRNDKNLHGGWKCPTAGRQTWSLGIFRLSPQHSDAGMTPYALYIESDDGPLPAQLAPQLEAGRLRVVRQVDLRTSHFDTAWGLITTAYLDQIDFEARANVIAAFLRRGGRIVFNGHILRPFIKGMRPFVPLARQRRSDLAIERLAPHPIFAGIPAQTHATQKGVAGFYGRGHNPPLAGATSLTGIGPDGLPVDWEWLLPDGGGIFVHSGNDLWGVSDDAAINATVAERVVAWSLAGRSEGAAA